MGNVKLSFSKKKSLKKNDQIFNCNNTLYNIAIFECGELELPQKDMWVQWLGIQNCAQSD